MAKKRKSKQRRARKTKSYMENIRNNVSKHVSKHVKRHVTPNVKKVHAFFGITGNANSRAWKTAKVGIVTALVGGIFKAIALTKTFPQPFDTLGNVILFIAFLIMLSTFLLGRF